MDFRKRCLTTRVWDPATGQYTEEELPADVQLLMGIAPVKKFKAEPTSSKEDVWGQGASHAPSTVSTTAKKVPQKGGAKVDTTAASVEFKGFSKVDMNDRYYLNESKQLNGKPTYWSSDGQFFIYWQGELSRWAICDAASIAAVRAGQFPGWAYKEDHKHLSQANGWMEAWAGSWSEPEIEVIYRSSSQDKKHWQDKALSNLVAAVGFQGFTMKELNTVYYLRSEQSIQGKPSFWDKSGVYFIYWQSSLKRWAICDTKCLDAVHEGQNPGWAFRSDSDHFANAAGWTEQRSGKWTNAHLVTSVISSSTKGLLVRLGGFNKKELNTQFVEKFDEEVQGRASFWDRSGDYFIYWQSSMNRWAISDSGSLQQAKHGLAPGWAYRTDSKHFAKGKQWMELQGRDWEAVHVTCEVLDGVVRELASVIKAELAEEPSFEEEASASGNIKLSKAKYKELIEKIYEEYNPEKLADVDTLMRKYGNGREHSLFQQVCDKYQVDADQTILDFVSSGGGVVNAGRGGNLPDMSATETAIHVQAIYEKHNPRKLQDMGRLLQKYRGRENELYLEVCQKYGIDPLNYVEARHRTMVKGEH